MPSQSICQKSFQNHLYQTRITIRSILIEISSAYRSNICCSYPTVRDSLTNGASLEQFRLKIHYYEALVEQRRRNVRKTPR